MSNLVQRMWHDDRGAVLSLEFLFFATILVIGLLVGMNAVRNAVVSEFSELAEAITGITQEYTVSGISGCCSEIAGSQADDDTAGPIIDPICTEPSSSLVDDIPCG